MALFNAPEFNSVGSNGGFPGMGGFGYGGGFGGGFGGGGILEGIILASLLGRDGFGRGRDGHDDDNCAKEAAILAAIASSKDVSVAEARALGAEICDTKGAIQTAAYAQAIQLMNVENSLKSQGVAFQIQAENTATQLGKLIVAEGAATRELINANTTQSLRDKIVALELESSEGRRRFSDREIEINIQNTAVAQQQQQQAQFKDLNNFLDRKFSDFDNQINNTKQGIINLGTMVASGTQSTAATNIGK